MPPIWPQICQRIAVRRTASAAAFGAVRPQYCTRAAWDRGFPVSGLRIYQGCAPLCATTAGLADVQLRLGRHAGSSIVPAPMPGLNPPKGIHVLLSSRSCSAVAHTPLMPWYYLGHVPYVSVLHARNNESKGKHRGNVL